MLKPYTAYDRVLELHRIRWEPKAIAKEVGLPIPSVKRMLGLVAPSKPRQPKAAKPPKVPKAAKPKAVKPPKAQKRPPVQPKPRPPKPESLEEKRPKRIASLSHTSTSRGRKLTLKPFAVKQDPKELFDRYSYLIYEWPPELQHSAARVLYNAVNEWCGKYQGDPLDFLQSRMAITPTADRWWARKHDEDSEVKS